MFDNFIWHWPQLTIICLWSFSIIIRGSQALATNRSALEAMIIQALAFGLFGTVLYYGGFWTGGIVP